MSNEPKKPEAELSEEELEKVSGGGEPPEPNRQMRPTLGDPGLNRGLGEPPDPIKTGH